MLEWLAEVGGIELQMAISKSTGDHQNVFEKSKAELHEKNRLKNRFSRRFSNGESG